MDLPHAQFTHRNARLGCALAVAPWEGQIGCRAFARRIAAKAVITVVCEWRWGGQVADEAGRKAHFRTDQKSRTATKPLQDVFLTGLDRFRNIFRNTDLRWWRRWDSNPQPLECDPTGGGCGLPPQLHTCKGHVNLSPNRGMSSVPNTPHIPNQKRYKNRYKASARRSSPDGVQISEAQAERVRGW